MGTFNTPAGDSVIPPTAVTENVELERLMLPSNVPLKLPNNRLVVPSIIKLESSAVKLPSSLTSSKVARATDSLTALI